MNLMMISATLAVSLLAGLAIFQAALIAGAPMGKFVWGGKHRVLPLKLRLSSAVTILLYGVFAALILSKSGMITLVDNLIIATAGVWVISIYLILATLLNGISHSKQERALMTPVSAVLAVLFLSVTLGL